MSRLTSSTRPGRWWPAGYCLLLLAGLGGALSLGGSVAVVGVLAVAAVCALVAARVTLVGAGLACAYGFAFTTPWNSVVFAHVRPGDALLLLGLLCFALHAGWGRWPGLPWWVLQLAAVILVLAVLHVLVPTATSYLAHRPNYNAIGQTVAAPATNSGIAVRWLVSLLGVPLLLVFAGGRVDTVRRLAAAYAYGCAVSALVAVTDNLGITAISAHFIVPDGGGRQAGLTVQANHLGATSTLALPVLCYLIARPGRVLPRIAAAAALVTCLAGIYESGSRGGALGGVLAILLTAAVLRRIRGGIPILVPLALTAVTAAFVADPGLFGSLGSATRLSGDQSTVSGSDSVRSALGAQSLSDFTHSPIRGVGFQVSLDAHDVPRQLMASGGLVLLMSFAVFAVLMLRRAANAGRNHELAVVLLVSAGLWLVLGLVENLLLDRYLYVPLGLIVALLAYDARVGPGTPPVAAAPRPAAVGAS